MERFYNFKGYIIDLEMVVIVSPINTSDVYTGGEGYFTLQLSVAGPANLTPHQSLPYTNIPIETELVEVNKDCYEWLPKEGEDVLYTSFINAWMKYKNSD